jgi:hypothetical protein
MALGSTQPLTDMIPGVFLGVKGIQCIRLTTSLPSVGQLSRKWGDSTSYNPMGLHGLLKGYFGA